MTILESIAVLILIIAIVVLVYYYFNDSEFASKVKTYVPNGVSDIRNTFYNDGAWDMEDNENENVSMSEKLKTKFKDIDMPNINTDAFSNRLDAFLNEKSDELIKDWELATKEDISSLEDRFKTVNEDIQGIEKRFNEYKDYTNEKLDSIDERLSKLENGEE
ncbi:MAG: hypothetical protein LBR24_01925 [Methanobrevibacter sp.]|jgi:hypothetical protein|nr:hypothetical protein [Methanobrevibacter sp.]